MAQKGEEIYTRLHEEVSLGLSSLTKFLLPRLHPASSDEYFSKALATRNLLPFLSQSYRDVLGSREKMSGGGNQGGGVLSVPLVPVGKTFSLRTVSYVLTDLYNLGLGGKKKKYSCLVSASQPLIRCVISVQNLSLSGPQCSHLQCKWSYCSLFQDCRRDGDEEAGHGP